jgi:hypothetical protein
MLEQMGAQTHYSCSGHPTSPKSFTFCFLRHCRSPRPSSAAGFFTVELERSQNAATPSWSLRTHNVDSDRERINVLRFAATQWERLFGPGLWDADA